MLNNIFPTNPTMKTKTKSSRKTTPRRRPKRSRSPFAKPTTIFMTGGTGFIGTKLANALSERGHKIRVLSRSTSNTEGLNHPRITLVPGDILDVASLKKAMKGCTQVYHLAAYPKNWSKDKSIYHTVNVEAMRNVFAAAKANKVKKVVFTSSIVTLGPSRRGEVRTESQPRITSKYYTDYEETKHIAEREAMEMAKKGFPVVIVNPTRVYGPGKLTEGNSMTLLIDLYDRGKSPVLLNDGENVGNYIFVNDLVEGFILAMERGKVGEQYILGGENASLKDVFAMIDHVSGKKHFTFNLPGGVALFYAGAQEFAAERFGIYPQITPPWIETFMQDWAYSSAKAQRELGLHITPLKEGLRKTYEWLVEYRKSK